MVILRLCQYFLNTDKIDQFIEDVSNLVHITNSNDAGCIFYNLHSVANAKNIFFLMEKWRSMDDLRKHSKSEHCQRFQKKRESGEYFKSTSIVYMLSDAVFNICNNNIDSNSKSTFIAVVRNDIKDDKIDSFIGAGYPCVVGTNKEKGCLAYNMYQDVRNKNNIFFIEKWESMKSLMHHFQTKHLRKFGGKIKYGGWAKTELKGFYRLSLPMVSVSANSKL